MARHPGLDEPVSEEDLEAMPEQIAEQFDRIRDLMDEELERDADDAPD